MKLLWRSVSLFFLSFLIAQCSLLEKQVPFPEFADARVLLGNERQDKLVPYQRFFETSQLESYRFLARARYTEKKSFRKAKQVFVFAPPGRLRVEEYSAVGNQLLLEFVMVDNKAHVKDVLNNSQEELSDAQDVFEYVLGVSLTPDELLDLFLGRCTGLPLEQAEVRKADTALLVERVHDKERVLCVLSEGGGSISRFFGSDSSILLQSTANTFTQVNEFLVPQHIYFFSPQTHRSAEFHLEHIGVNKPLAKTLFAPFKTEVGHEQ